MYQVQSKTIITPIHSWGALTVCKSLKQPICACCAYDVLHFTICALANAFLLVATWAHNQRMFWFVYFLLLFTFQNLGMCYLGMVCISSSKINDFPSIYGHKCWSVPKRFTSVTPSRNANTKLCHYEIDHVFSVLMSDCKIFLWLLTHVGRCSGS